LNARAIFRGIETCESQRLFIRATELHTQERVRVTKEYVQCSEAALGEGAQIRPTWLHLAIGVQRQALQRVFLDYGNANYHVNDALEIIGAYAVRDQVSNMHCHWNLC